VCVAPRTISTHTTVLNPTTKPTTNKTTNNSDKYYKAAKIADALARDVHYTVDEKQRSVLLTEDGCVGGGGLWEWLWLAVALLLLAAVGLLAVCFCRFRRCTYQHN
jgi:hypothetical protein